MSFSRLPNKIIDDSKLNPYQFQLFTIIVRKTDGWCKVEDGISLSQFQKLVSFGKMKIISTLKELEEMDFICKTKTFNTNGGKSYNMYKISSTLVSEVDKGSISDGQGVVSEVDIQKKAITKETNTTNKNTKKDLATKYIGENKIEDSRLIEIVKDFVSWRTTIKKPLKTTGPIKLYINALRVLQELGYKANDCIEQMKNNEWQTIKPEYIHKSNNQSKSTEKPQNDVDSILDEIYGKEETFDSEQDMEVLTYES